MVDEYSLFYACVTEAVKLEELDELNGTTFGYCEVESMSSATDLLGRPVMTVNAQYIPAEGAPVWTTNPEYASGLQWTRNSTYASAGSNGGSAMSQRRPGEGQFVTADAVGSPADWVVVDNTLYVRADRTIANSDLAHSSNSRPIDADEL